MVFVNIKYLMFLTLGESSESLKQGVKRTQVHVLLQ